MKNISRLSAAMLPVAALTGCADKLPEKPNIIFLLFDDMGYGDLGCYGQELIETPNIDALAQQGIIFTDMYSSAPISAPSRCSIITGKHAGHDGQQQGQPGIHTKADAHGAHSAAGGQRSIHRQIGNIQDPVCDVHTDGHNAPGQTLAQRTGQGIKEGEQEVHWISSGMFFFS